MARKKQIQDPPDSSGNWLTTFCDLTTLLLTFFVLLLTMSTIDEQRKRVALHSLVGAFGFLTGGRSPIGKEMGSDISEPSEPLVKNNVVKLDLLKEITMKNDLDLDVDLSRKDEKFVITLSQNVLFLPGTMELQPKVKRYLTMLSQVLIQSKQDIEIGGHVDRFEAMDQSDWPQCLWNLSTYRAMAVYDFFRNQGIPLGSMSAHGFSYYRPLVNGLEYPHLQHKNQRVEIILGYNDTIPIHLPKKREEPAPYFNYKDFFFKLFPSPKEPPGDKGIQNNEG
jgi:chemotaxis protein MotB